MRRAFLLAYSDAKISRKQITDFLNESSIIITWRYDMPNSYYIISEESASVISTELRTKITPFRHILVELDNNYSGWLPKESWYLIQNKRLKPKK